MNKYLPALEIRLYLLYYVSLLIVILYNVFNIDISSLPDYYFRDGWKFLNRKIDDYDYEWETWREFIKNSWYFYIIHTVLCELYRLFKFKNISFAFLTIGVTSTLIIFNIPILLILLFQFSTSFLCAKLNRISFVWILGLFWLAIINFLKTETNYEYLSTFLKVDSMKVHALLSIMCWNLLKGVSFGAEFKKDDRSFSFLNFIGYSFYFPTMLFGPNLIYSRYSKMIENYDKQESKNFGQNSQRMKNLAFKLLKYSFWFLLTEFALHYFYVNSIQYDFKLVKSLHPLEFFGLGYLMAQLFNIKYIIFYGTGIAFGEFDQIEMPNKPKCVCRIHKYADMWKWFDHGLYEFLFKYVYIALCKKSSSTYRKLFSGLLTFAFIYVWHGLYDFVLIWSIMNCLCVVIEKFLYHFLTTNTYLTFARKLVKTDNNIHRLNALLGVQVLIPSILSNFFFFGGKDIGLEFFERTYLSGFLTYFKISMGIYFLYPVAETIKRYENNQKEKQGHLKGSQEF